MASKIKRNKKGCRKSAKKSTKSGEAWWERLHNSKQRNTYNPEELFKSFSWWEPQKECSCERNCIHDIANQLTTRCVDLEASADRLSKPKNPCPSVLAPDKTRFRSFNWWRACKARERILPPSFQVPSLLALRRSRPPQHDCVSSSSPSPDRSRSGKPASGSDSSGTVDKVYRTFCWWDPCRRDRGRGRGRARSLSFGARSPRSAAGGDTGRRKRSLSPGGPRPPATPDVDQLFRTFSWWNMANECGPPAGPPAHPAKLRRHVSFDVGLTRDGAAAGSGDVPSDARRWAPSWEKTVVDKCHQEQKTMPTKPTPPSARPPPLHCRPAPPKGPRNGARTGGPRTGGPKTGQHAPAKGGAKTRELHNAWKNMRSPPKKGSPAVSVKSSKSEAAGSPGNKGPSSPARPKSPIRPKSPVRVKAPERPSSPTRAVSEPTVQKAAPPAIAPEDDAQSTSSGDTSRGSGGHSDGASSDHTTTTGRSSSPGAAGAGGAGSRPGSGSSRPGSGSSRPGSGSSRPGSALSRQSSGGRRSPDHAAAPGWRWPALPALSPPGLSLPRISLSQLGLAGFSPPRLRMPRLRRNTKNVLKAMLLFLFVGYTSVHYWKDIGELLGLEQQDPCGSPENIYFCI